MDKNELAKKINELESLTNEEKSELLKLLRSQKKYGLVWEDKPEDAEQRMLNEQPVLEEVPERAIISDDADAPNHILIEGDNLEALTALSYTHSGKIDVIYIDPPYNTRKKDFKYNDSYVDPDDAYSHSTWLSFISKRLKIAKGLLADNGVIFIQIDDREYAPLKLLCDGIFMESNSIGPFIQNKLNAKNDTLNVQRNHEYILCYRKMVQYINESQTKVAPNILIRTKKYKSVIKEDERYFYLNDSITTRGEGGTLNARPNLGYSFYYNPETKDLVPVADYDVELARTCNDAEMVYSSNEELLSQGFVVIRPPKVRGKLGCWTWDINKAKKDIDLLYVKETKNRFNVHKRTFVPADQVKEVSRGTYAYEVDVYSNSKSILEYSTNDGTDSFVEVMGYDTGFNNPKNINMMEYLLDIIPNKNSVVLDFFAGSGTTLHALMLLNENDGGHRQCILVTNNENGICENVTYERNKRVIQGYTTPKGEKVPGLTRNNLRYYKTKFVPRDKSPKNLRDLMVLSTDMLCIHNDTYTEKPFGGKNINKHLARYFENAQGTKRMLVVYNENAIPALVQLMKQVFDGEKKKLANADNEEVMQKRPNKLMVYVFAPNGYAYDDEFEDVADNIVLCAIPDAILNAYRRVLPKRKPQYLQEYLDSIESEKQDETGLESSERREADLFDFNSQDEISMAASEIHNTRTEENNNHQDSGKGGEA